MKACYAGSFDPLTLGHLDIVNRALLLFDDVTIAVGRNIGKSSLFSASERVDIIKAEVAEHKERVEVVAFEGLVADLCQQMGIGTLVRGIRTVGDFESEMAMAYTNRRLGKDLDTVVLFPSEPLAFISSRLIKEIAASGGPLQDFVPDGVAERLRSRFST